MIKQMLNLGFPTLEWLYAGDGHCGRYDQDIKNSEPMSRIVSNAEGLYALCKPTRWE